MQFWSTKSFFFFFYSIVILYLKKYKTFNVRYTENTIPLPVCSRPPVRAADTQVAHRASGVHRENMYTCYKKSARNVPWDFFLLFLAGLRGDFYVVLFFFREIIA